MLLRLLPFLWLIGGSICLQAQTHQLSFDTSFAYDWLAGRTIPDHVVHAEKIASPPGYSLGWRYVFHHNQTGFRFDVGLNYRRFHTGYRWWDTDPDDASFVAYSDFSASSAHLTFPLRFGYQFGNRRISPYASAGLLAAVGVWSGYTIETIWKFV